MYNYYEYVPITKDEILKRVSQEEIFSLVTNYIPEPNIYVKSPVREDDGEPGCWYDWYNGLLYFYDFADSKVTRDCFEMIKDILGLNFREVLQYISDKFELGVGGSVELAKPVLHSLPSFIKKEPEKETNIIFKAKTFKKQDAEYWSQYDISRADLISDNVFSIIWYKFYSNKKREWVVIRPNDICYAYSEFTPKVKIYRPFSVNKRGKWITNCHSEDIGGINRLIDTGKQLIITKSYKDYRVLKNQYLDVVWFQNEKIIPSDEILYDLIERFDEVIIFYDNDEAGIKGATSLNTKINSIFPEKSRFIHLPTELLKMGISDPSDFYKEKGREELEKFLEENMIHINEF